MHTSHSTIKSWNEDDRPREKLLLKGKKALSDAELVAILIGSGSKNESAVALSKRILSTVNNQLNNLGKCTIHDLTKFKGIGTAKAISIVAALELGKRRGLELAIASPKITSSQEVFKRMHPHLADLAHEEFWVLYLNNANKVLSTLQLSRGGLTSTVVDVRLVLKAALQLSAVGLILVHNHPSGTLTPSEADKTLTQKLSTAAKSLDIALLDHIIIGEKAYFSFADSDLL